MVKMASKYSKQVEMPPDLFEWLKGQAYEQRVISSSGQISMNELIVRILQSYKNKFESKKENE